MQWRRLRGRGADPTIAVMRNLVAVAALAALACRSRAQPAAPAGEDHGLPAVAGFARGPLVSGAGWFRRAYSLGRARVDVTIAAGVMPGDEAYQRWLDMSAPYPAASLDVPPGAGAGVFDCGNTAAPAGCDLHIQLRSGVHVELQSGGTASRDDLTALARGLPLRALAARQPVL